MLKAQVIPYTKILIPLLGAWSSEWTATLVLAGTTVLALVSELCNQDATDMLTKSMATNLHG